MFNLEFRYEEKDDDVAERTVWLVMLGLDGPHENHVVSVYDTEQEAHFEADQLQRTQPIRGWNYYASGPWELRRKGGQ